jgi:hypothetical protein
MMRWNKVIVKYNVLGDPSLPYHLVQTSQLLLGYRICSASLGRIRLRTCRQSHMENVYYINEIVIHVRMSNLLEQFRISTLVRVQP